MPSFNDLAADYIDVADAAELLDMTRQGVLYHVQAGNLTPLGKFGRALILSRAEVQALAAKKGGELQAQK